MGGLGAGALAAARNAEVLSRVRPATGVAQAPGDGIGDGPPEEAETGERRCAAPSGERAAATAIPAPRAEHDAAPASPAGGCNGGPSRRSIDTKPRKLWRALVPLTAGDSGKDGVPGHGGPTQEVLPLVLPPPRPAPPSPAPASEAGVADPTDGPRRPTMATGTFRRDTEDGGVSTSGGEAGRSADGETKRKLDPPRARGSGVGAGDDGCIGV